GSVLARSDAVGNVVARFEYQAWGERWAQAGVEGDRQFNGRVFDSGSGLYSYAARMYFAPIGRFISTDTAQPNPVSPVTFNRYSYVLNNPSKFVDPDGHLPFLAVTGAIGAVAGGVWGIYTSYRDYGHIEWGVVGRDALIGGAAGLTLGAGTAWLVAG